MIYTPNRAVGPAVRIVCLVVAACFLVAPGDRARASELPAAVRSSVSAPDEAAIDAHLKKAVALLTSEVPAEQAKGRDLIVGEVGPVGAGQPSPAFLFAYARSLNKQLLASAVKSPNMRVRLNAAVAAARVAEKADNRELADSIVAALNDPNEAVALWGMKGAKFILKPSLAPGAGVQPIIPLMLATAKKLPSTTGAAYESLRVNEPTPAVLPALIAGAQDLLDARLAIYKTAVPADPAAELVVASVLSDGTWWKAHTPAAKIRTVQLLVNLGTVAGERVVAAPPEAQDPLKLVVKQAAGAVVALGITEKKAEGLRAQLSVLERIGPRSQPSEVSQNSKLLFPAAQSVFPELKPMGAGAATNPTSMSATSATSAGDGK